MIILWISLAVLLGAIMGVISGVKVTLSRYDGIITMKEEEGTLTYSLIVLGDPELLANHKRAMFKIVPPSQQ